MNKLLLGAAALAFLAWVKKDETKKDDNPDVTPAQ